MNLERLHDVIDVNGSTLETKVRKVGNTYSKLVQTIGFSWVKQPYVVFVCKDQNAIDSAISELSRICYNNYRQVIFIKEDTNTLKVNNMYVVFTTPNTFTKDTKKVYSGILILDDVELDEKIDMTKNAITRLLRVHPVENTKNYNVWTSGEVPTHIGTLQFVGPQYQFQPSAPALTSSQLIELVVMIKYLNNDMNVEAIEEMLHS